MTTTEILLPKLGESVIEATITRWLKREGEMMNVDDPIVEVATDKVDSEIPSPFSGMLIKQLVKEGDVVPIGKAIAVIGIEAGVPVPEVTQKETIQSVPYSTPTVDKPVPGKSPQPGEEEALSRIRFYSPLVRNIARQENIPLKELEKINGSGKNDRLTKEDILQYLKQRAAGKTSSGRSDDLRAEPISLADEIIEMDRIRQIIAQHMVRSVQTSPHVTSFIEVDMSRVVQWRDRNKIRFEKEEKVKLTFTPFIIHAIAQSVKDYPMTNVSVDGTKIILHRNIHIGMAVALPNFNLILPVIRNADQKSFITLVKEVQDLADRARRGKLVPDEISGGTISLTNLGSFGMLAGTPIINQPQTAIIACGSITKRPVVIETDNGDVIGIRPVMILSLTYDHRVIDGALGGLFLGRMKQALEKFDLI